MQEHDHMGEWVGEIRRGKALGLIVAGATITDADGKAVDLSRLNADGTLNEDEAPTEAPASEEAGDETPKPKRKKAPAPTFDEAAAATKAKLAKTDDEA